MQTAQTKLKSVVIEATITRANGTVEPQGVVSYWHVNPLKRLTWARRRKSEQKEKN